MRERSEVEQFTALHNVMQEVKENSAIILLRRISYSRFIALSEIVRMKISSEGGQV